jgi:iron complex outermembrane receptor protein
VKRFLLFLPLSVTIQLLHGQNYISTLSDDSSRVIELKEITINSLQKTSQQRLVSYYRANNAATLEEIMSRLPEVSILRRGPYGMETTIRSFSAGQINVLIDGMRIHGACTDKMDPATIYVEPANLENLQVQTANAGFLSGSSIGGTVNMRIAEPQFDAAKKVTGIINSGYQSAARSFFESAQINYSENKWALRISGTYRKSQDYRSGSGDIVRFSQFEKVNYSLSVKYKLNQSAFIKTDLLADDGWNIGYPALPMDVGYANARIGAISMIQENNSRKLYKWQVKLYANKIRHFMDDTKRPNVPMHMDMPGKSVTYGGYFEGEIKINGKHRLQLIADASSTLLNASMTMYQPGQLPMYMLTWPDNRKNQYGIAAALSLPIDSSVKLQINARTDWANYRLMTEEAKNQVSIFGYSSAGRNDWLKNISAQLTKKINSRFKAGASIGYSERAGTASELFGFYLFNSSDGYDYIGNPRLKNENSIQGEVSGTYSRKNNRLQLTLFCSHINNYITGITNPGFSSMTIGAKGVKSLENISNATITGAEVSAVINTGSKTEMVSTLRYNRGTDNNKQPLSFISPIKNVSSVRYKAGNFTAQLESEAATAQKRVSVKTGEDATPGYVLFHIRLGYLFSFLQKKIQIQSGIENLLDKEYHDHLDWGNISRPGRNIYLQVKVIF